MRDRCIYGGLGRLGVRICCRWLGENGFSNFLVDMGKRPLGKTIDRVDGNGHYVPDNCRWATPMQQRSNRVHVIDIIEWSPCTECPQKNNDHQQETWQEAENDPSP
jgi:hypothetical protein